MHPVAVGPRAGVPPCVEAVRGRGSASITAISRRQQRVDPLRERVRWLAVELEARHLPPGVDPGVGAAGDRERRRLAEDPLQRRLELALDRALARLRRPAGERRRRRRRSSAGSAMPGAATRLGRSDAALDELEEDHLGRVRAARAELDDPRVAAGALRVARARSPRTACGRGTGPGPSVGQRLAPGVEVAALGERDQLLDLGLDRLGLRLAGLDPLVLDQLAREVAQQRLAMRRVTAELVSSACRGASGSAGRRTPAAASSPSAVQRRP